MAVIVPSGYSSFKESVYHVYPQEIDSLIIGDYVFRDNDGK